LVRTIPSRKHPTWNDGYGRRREERCSGPEPYLIQKRKTKIKGTIIE